MSQLVRKLFAFIAIGSFFTTVEEFLTVLLLRRDVGAFVVTVLIVFPVYFTFVFFSSKHLDKAFDKDSRRELAHLLVYGFVGLMLEWFLMGHPPWSNPDAHPLLMFGFQLGMLSFWSAISFVPRLFLVERKLNRRVRRQILWFYIPYFFAVYVAGFTVPTHWRFLTIIASIIVGYIVLNVLFLMYFIHVLQDEQAQATNDRPA